MMPEILLFGASGAEIIVVRVQNKGQLVAEIGGHGGHGVAMERGGRKGMQQKMRGYNRGMGADSQFMPDYLISSEL